MSSNNGPAPRVSRIMVVAYDRRGYTRSVLDRAQDYVHGLETDADDARRLIEHLSDKPAVVFGTMPVVGKSLSRDH
jgi:pimeloyl-ACP methyl ester carboxylesterase